MAVSLELGYVPVRAAVSSAMVLEHKRGAQLGVRIMQRHPQTPSPAQPVNNPHRMRRMSLSALSSLNRQCSSSSNSLLMRSATWGEERVGCNSHVGAWGGNESWHSFPQIIYFGCL